MSKKVPQKQEYKDDCVGACHSAESNCACAVWRRTLLPSVYSFSSKRCFQNLARSKDGDGAALAAQRNKSPNAPCVCVPFERRHKMYPCAQVMSQRRWGIFKKISAVLICDYLNPLPTCCTCSKERANPSEKLRLLSLCSPFPALHWFLEAIFSLLFFPSQFYSFNLSGMVAGAPSDCPVGRPDDGWRVCSGPVALSEAEKSRRTGGFNIQKWP